MEKLRVYLPRDRFLALALGTGDLPDRAQGAALFADLSGFTRLAEALAQTLKASRGAEELTRYLNLVYAAVIHEVDQYSGSVIAFAGDAMTCWFDRDDGRRATASALAMQKVMQRFASVPLPNGGTVELAIRVGIAVGPVRRFQLGDPSIQVIDTVAGESLARMAAAQVAAKIGEVVVDEACARALGQPISDEQWRPGRDASERFAVVTRLEQAIEPLPWPELETAVVAEARLRPWLLSPVYARIQTQQGQFLTEMRPAVAMFIRFEGIDYDQDDDSGVKLDAYIRWVQKSLTAYEGFLIEITIGDKGSYIYAVFGAPIAHENDIWRALTVAWTLRTPPPELDFIHSVQIGISRGTMRVGAYGGETRRTYGIQGDDVNLAARLMQRAASGQVLASGHIYKSASNDFLWQGLSPVKLKGKSELVPVYALLGPARRGVHLHEPEYPLPLVGRTAELHLIRERIGMAAAGHGQVLGITGEAGVGKSRLLSEALKLANQESMTGFGGQCHSYGMNTSYLAWWPIWQAFFGLDVDASVEQQIRALELRLSQIHPDLVQRLPLLGPVTRLAIPENDLTRALDAKLRKSSLEALLMDCLRARARQGPLYLVLEDCHWMDPLSRDLFDVAAGAISDLPVLLLLAYRPPDAAQSQTDRFRELPCFTEVPLAGFSTVEAEALIRFKIQKVFGNQAEPPAKLVERFIAQAEGNPFYIEELINYLQDREIGIGDTAALEHLELPTSLHSLILSRIDQLTEEQKIALKVASVIGRIFGAAMLWGCYPELGQPEKVKANLEVLHRLDVTSVDVPEPDLIYIFKHVVTQEVAYASLPFATRAMLHSRIGGFIETSHADQLEQSLDILAFHFDRSDNVSKKRDYLLRAGVAAQARYANAAALDYYRRVQPLLAGHEQIDVMLRSGQVLELLGQWDQAKGTYEQALALAEQTAKGLSRARCQTAMGELSRKQAHYGEAAQWFAQAQDGFAQLGEEAGVAQVLHYAGTLAAQQGDHDRGRSMYLQSLEIRRKLSDKGRIGSLLSNLGILAHQYSGDGAEARRLHEEALAIRRELGDRWAIANSLNNLGVLFQDQGDLSAARAVLEESVALNRQVGDRWAIANSLSSLAAVTLDQQDVATTQRLLQESLAINRELKENRAIAFLLEYFAKLAALQNQPERVLCLIGAAAALRESLGAPLSPAELTQQAQLVARACKEWPIDRRKVALSAGAAMSFEEALHLAVGEDQPVVTS